MMRMRMETKDDEVAGRREVYAIGTGSDGEGR